MLQPQNQEVLRSICVNVGEKPRRLSRFSIQNSDLEPIHEQLFMGLKT